MYFVLSFSNYKDWSLYEDAQAICRRHIVLTFCDPAFFLFLLNSFIYLLLKSMIIFILEVVRLQMK